RRKGNPLALRATKRDEGCLSPARNRDRDGANSSTEPAPRFLSSRSQRHGPLQCRSVTLGFWRKAFEASTAFPHRCIRIFGVDVCGEYARARYSKRSGGGIYCSR